MREPASALKTGALIFLISALACMRPVLSAAAFQPDPSITPFSVLGEVVEIRPDPRQIIVKTDAGSMVTVFLDERTAYMRIPPGEKTKDKFIKIAATDFKVGDRVFVRGRVAQDRKSVPALEFYVMTREDITQKQEREREDWRRRGVAGVVTALNPETKEITLAQRSSAGNQPITIKVKDVTTLRRYAPDSIKFSDAQPAAFADIKVGDQLRARGEKSADATQFMAEEIVTGSFRTAGGTVTAVNPEASEIKINDIQSRQPLTVVVGKDTVLRRLTPEAAATLAPAKGSEGPNSRPAKSAADFQEIFERLPTVTLAELKPGEMIVLSSTVGADPKRLTAIALLAGADLLLKAQGGSQQNRLGAVDFGIGGP
jgi:hypothetical protein